MNVDRKIYAKILAVRLDKFLSKLIHTDQIGFIKQRNIHDNLLDLLSGIDYVNHKDMDAILVNVDFRKAFDNVTWDFIDCTLEFFNVGPIYRTMVQHSLRGVKACTINCGITSNYFELEKGLRQGSPNSSGIFDVVIEILTLKIRQTPEIIGIEIGPTHKKLGQYADDLWALLRGTEKNLNNFMAVLKDFAKASGLNMNAQKTQILRLGSLKNSNVEFKTDEKLQWVKETKVLGITVSVDRQGMLEKTIKHSLKRWVKS